MKYSQINVQTTTQVSAFLEDINDDKLVNIVRYDLFLLDNDGIW